MKLPPATDPALLTLWRSEQPLQDYAEILPAILEKISSAKNSIEIEMYIFRRDVVGEKILQSLIAAANRGIVVKLVVDGLGSPEFDAPALRELKTKGLLVRVYKPRGPFLKTLTSLLIRFRWHRLLKTVSEMNRRNHQKKFIFDGISALIGSANLSQNYLNWRETAVLVEGPGLAYLQKTFQWVWERSHDFTRPRPIKNKKLKKLMWRHRWLTLQTRLHMIAQAKDHILILNPYFLPPYHLLVPLLRAVRRGVQVELITSNKGDIFFVNWFARRYFNLLLRKGVRVYTHPQTVHAKVMLVDNQALVGSSNYNHRSLNLDLEMDVLLKSPSAIQKLNQAFVQDRSKSVLLHPLPISRYWKFFLSLLNFLKRNS